MHSLTSISKTLWIAAALAAGLLLHPGAAEAQKTLKVVPATDLKVLDPYATTAMITSMHGAAVYDTLFGWDEKMEAKPQMVEGYTLSPDKLKYTFTLRPGLKFHDGSAVTSKDVVQSLKRIMARDTLGQKLAESVASVDRVDDRTFTISMKQPYPWVEFSLGGTNNNMGIMREKEALTDPFTPITKSIGSGPFLFMKDEWVPGAKVVYNKNSNYVPRTEPANGLAGGKVVKVDRVEFAVIPDAETAFAALRAGEVDYILEPTLDLIPTVENNPNIVIGEVFPFGFYGVVRPNHLHPPFNNVKARLALAYMVDQKEYGAAAFGSQKYWAECYAFWICGSPNETAAGSDDFRKPNLEKARQLMKESGYNGEKIIVMGPSEIPSYRALTLMTADRLKQIGVNVDLQLSDWGNVTTRRAKKDAPEKGGWHIFHTTTGASPQASPLTSSSTNTNCDGNNWPGWPCDQVAEDLRDQFIREADPVKRKEIVEKMNRRLWEVIPFVPTGQYTQPFLWRSNISGVLRTSTVVFWNIEKR